MQRTICQENIAPPVDNTKLSISVIVPAYNEEHNLESTVQNIVIAAGNRFDDYELLIINDGSRDGTGAVADRLAKENLHIKAIHNGVNRGLAYSYRRGVALATMGYLALIPGDDEIRKSSVQSIFEAIGSADIVVPYTVNTWDRPLSRRVISRAFTMVVNFLFGLNLKYFQGPCVYPSELAQALPVTTSGFVYLTEVLVMAIKSGYSYVEVGMHLKPRSYGRSKAVSLANIVNTLKTIVMLFWSINIRRLRVKP